MRTLLALAILVWSGFALARTCTEDQVEAAREVKQILYQNMDLLNISGVNTVGISGCDPYSLYVLAKVPHLLLPAAPVCGVLISFENLKIARKVSYYILEKFGPEIKASNGEVIALCGRVFNEKVKAFPELN